MIMIIIIIIIIIIQENYKAPTLWLKASSRRDFRGWLVVSLAGQQAKLFAW